MAIDPWRDSILTFPQAARLVPKIHRGKSTHLSTIHRWVQRGVGGVHLETISIGGSRCTSREALERFFSLITAKKNRGGTCEPTRTEAESARRRAGQIEVELDQLGF